MNLPLRGRPITIGDRVREEFKRCDLMREKFEDNIDNLQRNIINETEILDNLIKKRNLTANDINERKRQQIEFDLKI